MISKVDLVDFWEITRSLYGSGDTSEDELALVRLLADTGETGVPGALKPADGTLANSESALAA